MKTNLGRWDAIIVGGGPAGSTLAWKMVQAGWRPLVLDKAFFPRDKPCAGWITPPVLDGLKLDVDAYRRGRTFQVFTGFRASRFSTRPVTLDYGVPVSFGILRHEFDEYLLRRSRADVVENFRVSQIERLDGGWLVNGQYWSRILVGAGGHFCPVARLLGANLKQEKKLSTLELEIPLDDRQLGECRVVKTIPELVYFDDLRGYGWIFRKGETINIGIGRTQNQRLKHYLELFLEEVERRGLIRLPVKVIPRFRGHPYKLHFVTPRTCVADGVLLVGDSAGLSFNYSGEGIRPAVESALMAWATLSAANGDYSCDCLVDYQRRLYAAYGKPVTGWRFRMMESLPPLFFQSIGRLIFSSSALVRTLFVDRLFLRRPSFEEPGK